MNNGQRQQNQFATLANEGPLEENPRTGHSSGFQRVNSSKASSSSTRHFSTQSAKKRGAVNFRLVCLLEGTIIEVHETYGFLLAEPSVGSAVYDVTEKASGRFRFKFTSRLNEAEKFDINDSVTFSLKVFEQQPGRLDGAMKYEVFDVALRYLRTDEEIYNCRFDQESDEISEGLTKKCTASAKPKIKIEGMIVSWVISKQCCFVKPLTKLPRGVFKPDNFYLHLSNLAALDLNLVFGDNVQIVVNPNQAEKMRADRGVLTSLSPKGHSDVNRVVFKTLEFLKKADDDEKYLASQVYETKPIFALFGYFLNFRRVPHSEFMNPLFAILKVLSFLLARLNQQFIKEVLEFAMNNGLFDRDGLLWRLIFSCPTPVLALSRTFLNQVGDSGSRTSPLNANELFKLLLNCVEIYPNCSRKVHNLIASRASVCGHEVLLGLVRVLSQPYARREDTTHRELKLVPTNDELQQFILNEEGHLNLSNLRPVIERGPYESVEGYIETYFNLLRFDCFYNFLVGLKNYMKGNHDSRDTNVYREGSLLGIGLGRLSAAMTFTISSTLESKKKLKEKDDTTKYFLHGNLVAVFPNETLATEPIWTTVNEKGCVLPDGSLSVNLTFSKDANSKSFIECFQTLVQSSGYLLLIESPTYYLSYWPVMKALQNLEPKSLPFQEELVMGKAVENGSSTFGFATQRDSKNELFDSNDYRDECSNFNFDSLNRNSLKSCSISSLTSSTFLEEQMDSKQVMGLSKLAKEVLGDVELDPSQNKALTHLLEHRLAVVQGPPGTGKTFLGVQALKVLLDEKTVPINGPILVLTYKNHALDEFSKQIVKQALSPNHVGNNEFVRVGGQSKDEEMEKYSLRNLLGGASSLERSLVENVNKFSDSFRAECEVFEKNSKRLDIDVLKRNLSASQIANLISAFVGNNPQWQKSLFDLKAHFKDITNMAIVLYKLLDKREYRTGIENLENLFTEALDAWLPDNRTISDLVCAERRKRTIEQQKLLAKSADSVTVNGNAQNTQTESEDIDTQDLDDEDLGKVADTRAELSLGGPTDSGLQDWLTFEVDETQETNPTSNLCTRHYGLLTKYFASKVDMADFKLIPNIYDLSLVERFHFLQAMLAKQCEVTSTKLRSSFDQYEALAMQVRKVTSSREVEVLKKAKIVAMTITGAAIRNEILNTVKPSVIIVEEAAEISEAHLMALLGSHVKHLMLIGDHKQLRPQVECYNLVKKYHFDISMMERLINNKLPFATLANQNRMRPDISKYLIDIYPELRDSARVLDNPEVTGLQKNFFFWDHGHREKKGRSPVNPVEAEAALALAKYLIDINGYSLNQITIICGYKGQTALLRQNAKSVFKENERLDVQTIDMFQGDENDIVIVSTTRCNPERRPGFMSILNRRCVAQSRGKSGVYFLGNAETLCAVTTIGPNHKKETVWTPLVASLRNDGCFGDHLVLECKNHKDVTKALRVGDNFPKPGNLLCEQKCPIWKTCGVHVCQEKCQPYHDDLHSKECHEVVTFDYKCGKHSTTKECCRDPNWFICPHECNFKFHDEEGADVDAHNCTKKCEPKHTHDKCYTEINFSCEQCGHSLRRYCWENPKTIICNAKVSFVFKFCGVHEGERKCYENELTKKCRNPCLKLMEPCNHPCEKKCESKHDHDSVLMLCKYRINYCCSDCGGEKLRLCYQKDSDIRCEKELIFLYPQCGRHKGLRKCFEKVDDKVCPKECGLPLPNCLHPCRKACSGTHSHDLGMNKCKEIMDFKHRCQKSLTRYCWQSEDSVLCDGPCVAILKCQHKCHLKCDPEHDHEANPEINCQQIVQERCVNCGNYLSRKCSEKLDSSKCSAEVKIKHSCGFEMFKPCNKPENEIFCKGPCVEKLKCGHRCVYKCGSVHNHDYPCVESVDFLCKSCSESLKKKCSENEEEVVCTGQCTEKLQCGHRCVEKCGLKHSHKYCCHESVPFNCRCCSEKLTRKCCESEDDVNCSGEMTHLCMKCDYESRGPCQKSKLKFKCFLPCVQKLECGHICSQRCFEVCTTASCQTCISAELEKARIESQRRQAQKWREIQDKKAEIQNELMNSRRNPRKQVLQYYINPEGEESSPYFEVRDMTLKFLKVQKGFMVKIVSISVIYNRWAKRRQTENQLELKDPTNKKALCYFTTESAAKVENYVNKGFHEKFGGANKSCANTNKDPIQFSTTSSEVRFKSENFYFNVLVCDVLIGKAKTVSCWRNTQCDSRFDSIFYASKSDSESSKYLIFNPFNVVVTHLVEFTLEPIKSLANDFDRDKNLRNGEFQKISLEPSRNLIIDDQKQYYYRLAESQFLRWCKGNPNESLKSVDLFFNPDLEEKFNKKKSEFESSYKNDKDTKEIFAFHGTPIDDPDLIMKGNFRLDLIKAFAFGYGIYFSEYPATSLEYASTTGNLILARVLLGKSVASNTCQRMSCSRREPCSEHDSHTVNPGKDGYANMVIIQNVDQILPMFIIRTV